MSELGPHTQRLIELARAEDDPSEEAAAAVGGKLMSHLGLPFVLPTGGESLAPGAAATSGSAAAAPGFFGTISGVKAALVISGALALGGAGIIALQDSPKSGHLPTTAGAPSPTEQGKGKGEVAPPTEGLSASKAEEESLENSNKLPQDGPDSNDDTIPSRGKASPQSKKVSRQVTKQTQATATSVDSRSQVPALAPSSLEQEARALRAAQRALRSGNTEKALALLDSQGKQFSSGQLGEERAAARAIARCQQLKSQKQPESGDNPSVSQTKRAPQAEYSGFARRWPGSLLLPRVRSACSLSK